MKLLNVSILCLGMLPALSFGEEVPAENAVESAVEKTVEENEAAKANASGRPFSPLFSP